MPSLAPWEMHARPVKPALDRGTAGADENKERRSWGEKGERLHEELAWFLLLFYLHI